MLRTALAAVACLAAVTLSVAMTRGENADPNAEPPDVLVPAVEVFEQPVSGVGVTSEAGVVGTVVIDAVPGAGAVVIGEQAQVAQGEPGAAVTVEVEQPAAGAAGNAPYLVSRVLALNALDPTTREALERLTRELEESAAALDKEGKAAEAQQKRQSMQAIRRLLQGGGRGFGAIPGGMGGRGGMLMPGGMGGRGGMVMRPFGEMGESAKIKQLEDLKARLKERVDAGKTDEAEAIKKDIAKVEEQLRATKLRLLQRANQYAAGVATTPPAVYPPQAIPLPMTLAFTQAHPHANPDDLDKQVKALADAAASLKEAGLADQARMMAEQAEQVKRQAEQARVAAKMFVYHAGPDKLHEAIRELRDEVAQLRKEVAQVRELLEKKQ